MNYKKQKKAQIMLITLIVLMIVAISVIGITILINRDTEQVAQNQAYTQIANATESKLNTYVREFGGLNFDLTQDLPAECNEFFDPMAPNDIVYTCEFSDNEFSTLFVDIETEFRDTNSITEVPVQVDQAYTIRLVDSSGTTGYRNQLHLEWTGSIALEFTLIYENSLAGTFEAIKDIYDGHGVFESFNTAPQPGLAQNPNDNSPNAYHEFTFLTNVNSLTPAQNATTIDLAAILGASPDLIPQYLLVTPRKNPSTAILATDLTVEPENEATFPPQLREFVVIGFDSTNEESPSATFTSSIPLVPQLDSIFNYALLTRDPIIF